MLEGGTQLLLVLCFIACFLFGCLFIYLLFVWLLVHLFICLLGCLFIYLFVCLVACSSICLVGNFDRQQLMHAQEGGKGRVWEGGTKLLLVVCLFASCLFVCMVVVRLHFESCLTSFSDSCDYYIVTDTGVRFRSQVQVSDH